MTPFQLLLLPHTHLHSYIHMQFTQRCYILALSIRLETKMLFNVNISVSHRIKSSGKFTVNTHLEWSWKDELDATKSKSKSKIKIKIKKKPTTQSHLDLCRAAGWLECLLFSTFKPTSLCSHALSTLRRTNCAGKYAVKFVRNSKNGICEIISRNSCSNLCLQNFAAPPSVPSPECLWGFWCCGMALFGFPSGGWNVLGDSDQIHSVGASKAIVRCSSHNFFNPSGRK